MKTEVLNPALQAARDRMEELVKDLHNLSAEVGNETLQNTLSDLRNRIRDPFMFVIVGEVKAGKSSFINALLDTGREIAPAAPQPMTDTIQQIVYGETEETVIINPFLKKIMLPVDILREIAIVDTPGTNTIVEQHQEITEDFIPASDLVVFVFEAKNPYRQSAWDFFRFIHRDWQKKILFVLQQKDLMPASDLEINEQGVRAQAEKLGMTNPLVFSVSAKQEQEGEKELSGFVPLREHIRTHITGGKAAWLKLENNLQLCQTIVTRFREALKQREAQREADLLFRNDIGRDLDEHSERSNRQVDLLVENILAGYQRITRQKEEELQQGLSFGNLIKRSLAGLFTKQASIKEWLEKLALELERDLRLELEHKVNSSVHDLAESIQQMARVIQLKIQQTESNRLRKDTLFTDIAERRSQVLQDLQQTFVDFTKKEENFRASELFPGQHNLSPNIVTGGSVAILGAILTAITNMAVFDITGGILTAVGLLFAGVSTGLKRNSLLRSFRKEVHKGHDKLERELNVRLKDYVQLIRQRLNQNFDEFDALLESEQKQIQALSVKIEGMEKRVGGIRSGTRGDER